MKRIGLTGGIACGKTTVLAHWLQATGPRWTAIESDELAHRALAPGTETYRAVREEFGEEICRPDGTIDRGRLGDMVFADPARLERLNALVHPVVREQWTAALERLAGAADVAVAVTAIPLLFEVGAADQFDCVVAVGCSESTQLARLGEKGLTAAQARARIAAQWPVQRKLDQADYVIWNDGNRATLAQQADLVRAAIEEN